APFRSVRGSDGARPAYLYRTRGPRPPPAPQPAEETPMQKRAAAVTFKGNPMTLAGPQLKPGDTAPDFTCANSAATTVSLKDTPGKARMFSVVPSLDTPVCGMQTRTFDKGLAELGDKVACYTVSLDTPFAQKRFCTDAGVN